MGFVILLLSVLTLAAGVGLAVATFARGKRSAHAREGAAWVPAVILIAIGLIGVLVFAFSSMGMGPMRNMMGVPAG